VAQLDFFAALDESLDILEDILRRPGMRVYVGQGPFERPEAPSFVVLTDTIKDQLRDADPGMLYLHGPFSTSPPLFTRQTQGVHAGKYYLFQTGGGPSISFSIARERSVGGRRTLVSGRLQTQLEYELQPGSWEKPASAFRDARVEVFAAVRRRLRRYERAMWIAPEALALFQARQVQIMAVGILAALGYLPKPPELTERAGGYSELIELFERYGVANVVDAVKRTTSKFDARQLLEELPSVTAAEPAVAADGASRRR
jgi:hypothetical protein